MLQIFFAILAGILTIGTPCILPVLPIVLGTSVGSSSRSRPIFIALGFALSFAFISLLFAAFTRILGLGQNQIRDFGTVLLFIFGFFMLVPSVFEKAVSVISPAIQKTTAIQNRFSGNAGGFVTGLTIGIIWAPCAGPVLGAILTLIATSKDFSTGAILLVFYALGAGIPMLLVGYGGQLATTKVRSLSRYAAPIQKVFALLIIALAVAMVFNYDTLLTAKISEHFPSLVNPKY